MAEPVQVVQPVTTVVQPVTAVVQEPVVVSSPTRVISSPRETIHPSRISKGDPYEVGKTYLGMGSPSRSYTVVDDSNSKVFTTTPSKGRTADELIREGYSPSVINLTQEPVTTYAPTTTVVDTTPKYVPSTTVVDNSPQYVSTTPTYTTTPNLFVEQSSPTRVATSYVNPITSASPVRTQVYGNPVSTQVYANPVPAQTYVASSPLRAYGAPGPTLSVQNVATAGGSPYRYEAVSPQIATNYSSTVVSNPVTYGSPVRTSVYN
jgi:hypothetical protein